MLGQEKSKFCKWCLYVFCAIIILVIFKSLLVNEKNNFTIESGIENVYAQSILSEQEYQEIITMAQQKQKSLEESSKTNITPSPMLTPTLTLTNAPTFTPTPKVIIYNQRIDEIVEKASEKYDIDKYMIHAIIKQESDYDSKSLSNAGACGLMQLLPSTAKIFDVHGKDIWNDEKNIDAGTRYYRDLLKEFNGDISLALAGYNAGGGAVKKYGNKIPPYKQTQEYVPAVLRHYKNFISRKG